MVDVLQRAVWDGAPKVLARWWTVRKGNRSAECFLYSHQLGWELRLVGVDDLPRTQVCRRQDEVLDTQEQWKHALHEKGWT